MPDSLKLLILALTIAAWGANPSRAGNSNSQMAIDHAGHRVAIVDADEGVLAIIDAKEHKLIRRIDVPGKPQCVCWIGETNRLAITLYDVDAVQVIDAVTGDIGSKIDVGDEPYGIISDPLGSRLWITLDCPGEAVEVDVASHKVTRRLKVEPFLRGIALAPDAKSLYVTGYHTGQLHAIDIETWQMKRTWTGQPSDNLCRSVVIHPHGTKAYLTHIRSRTHVVHARGAIVPFLGVCDLTPNAAVARRGIALDTYNGVYVTTNAWESDVSPDGKSLATIYAGTDDMNISTMLDDGYREIKRQAIVQTGKNPRAVRFLPDGSDIYVYEAVDFKLSVFDASTLKRTAGVSLGTPNRPADWRRGKELFQTSKAPMSNARWVSCSSCHPDGQADGRTWQNPEGLRRTPSLAGLAHTHPLHWSGDRDEVQDFEYTIRGPLMGGGGLLPGRIKSKVEFALVELDEPLAGKSRDLDALTTYTNSFSFTLSPHAAGPGQLTEAAERGKKLFFDSQTQCATCHSGPYYTDSRLQKPFNLHDVGTGDPGDKMGPKYDTPTLLGTYRNRTWLHHGKALSLEEVLTKFNPRDQHGKTSHLNNANRSDLIEFLKSLPNEQPAESTANPISSRK